jgi:hypothetical protein
LARAKAGEAVLARKRRRRFIIVTNGVFDGDLHALLLLVRDRRHLDGGVDHARDAQVLEHAGRESPGVDFMKPFRPKFTGKTKYII